VPIGNPSGSQGWPVRFPPWHAVADPRVYLFSYPYAAVGELFGMTGDASTDAVSLFWQEARIPVFGSPPEDWNKLSEVVEKVGVPGVTFGTIVWDSTMNR
jgi:hypothetical protein